MKKGIFLLVCLVGMASCSDHKDLYNPNANPKDNPLDMEVSKDFDWSMMTDLNVLVNVDDQYEGRYSYVIEIFDSNPVISSDAILLARGKAKKGEPYSVTLKAGKGLKTIYVKQTDPTKLTKTRAFNVDGSTVNCDFTNNVNNRSLSSRNVARGFVTMEIPSKDVFPSGCPSGLSEFNSDSFVANGTYRVTSKTKKIELWQPGITLYVVEDVVLDSDIYLTAGSKVYVLSGKKLAMPQSRNNGQSDCFISVGVNASLVVTGDIQLDSNFKLYNKGSVTAANFSCTNNSYLYNEGVLNLSGKLSGENSGSNILNLETLLAEELSVQGNSHFENRGTATIKGLSTVNCTDGSWKNEGIYTTENMNVSAWNDFIFNACRLTVKNKLSLRETKMQVEGSVITRDFYINNSRVELVGGTFFNVTGVAVYGYNKTPHGFFAMAEEKALLRLNEVQTENENYPIINYGGALTIVYVSKTSPHPYSENQDASDNKYWTQDLSVEWADELENKTDVVIQESTCNPGYSNTPSEPEEPTVEDVEAWVGIYAMEDNWPLYGDYDMNDVVVKAAVSMKLDDNKFVKEADVEIGLMAVGAAKTIAAAIQLDKITAEMLRTSGNYSVKHDDPADIAGFSVVSNACNIEQGQTKVVIPLFTNASQLLGGNYVNVGKGQNKEYKKIKINLCFEEGRVVKSMLQDRNFNFFIMTNGVQSGRTEIHLRSFAVTDLGDKTLQGQEDDNGNFVSSSGLVWGLLIPSSSWKWPDENDNIKNVYSYFESWATSNGVQHSDWYNKPAEF